MVFCQDDHVAGSVNGRLVEGDECNWYFDRKVVDTREQPEDGAADDENGFSLED